MDNLTKRFDGAVAVLLYIFAAALPLWFYPIGVSLEFSREMLFGAITIIALVMQLVIILRTNEFRFFESPLLYSAGILLGVMLVSSFFSRSALLSFFFSEATAERFSFLFFGLLLMTLVSTALNSERRIKTFLGFLAVSGTVASALALFQFYGMSILQKIGVQIASGADFNVIGTINGLSLFLLSLLLLNLGLLFFGNPETIALRVKIFLFASSVLHMLVLLIINYRGTWEVLLASSVFLFGLVLQKSRKKENKKFGWRYWFAFGLVLSSILFILIRAPLIKNVQFPLEVNPSFSGTLNLAKSVMNEGVKNVLLGSGPGTFGLDWSKYKDPAINQTPFWSVRFNQGFSYVATLLATTGVLGLLAFLSLIGTALFMFLKYLLNSKPNHELASGLMLPLTGLIFAFFLYPANLSFSILFFILTGTIVSSLGSEDSKIKGFWSIKERVVKLESSWAVFLSSLFIIFLVSLGVAAFYFEVNKVKAARYWVQGNNELRNGKPDEGASNFQAALSLDEKDPKNHQALLLSKTEIIRNLIQRAGRGENVQNDFQSAVSGAIQISQRALVLYPEEPIFWREQGALYEIIIPFIANAEKFAFSSYQKALELDPRNPALMADLGRSYFIYAEKIQLLAGQTSSSAKREELAREQTAALELAGKAFQRSAEIKPDFAQAHFLLAQTAVRMNKINDAIKSAENAKQIAPGDIGISFQLGLLYYQTNNLNRAEDEFSRAVALNENYSNARYFLGLIYDRRGDRKGAIREFQRVREFNPGNQEVAKILNNLSNGRSALDGIAPPPPEQRKGTPIKENEGKK